MNKKTIFIVAFIVVVIGLFVFKYFLNSTNSDNGETKQTASPEIAETFQQVFAHKLPVLTELGAEWCAPCKQMKPVLQKIALDYKGRLIVDQVNVDIETDKVQSYAKYVQLRVIPVQLLIDAGGKLLWKHEGYIADNELRQIIYDNTGVK